MDKKSIQNKNRKTEKTHVAVSQVSRGERVKVPNPAPHRQIAMARERCLGKKNYNKKRS